MLKSAGGNVPPIRASLVLVSNEIVFRTSQTFHLPKIGRLYAALFSGFRGYSDEPPI
jgi:hypothetical protein